MGQLERYGLYVLCVVIFLILGVALWGGDPAVLPAPPSTALEVAHKQAQVPAPAPERDDVVERLRREFSTSSVRNQAPPLLDASLALSGVRNAILDPTDGGLGGVKPVPAVAPATSAREYEVKKNDVLESIAEAELGAKNHWRDILAANPGLVATRLRPGMKIKLPAVTKTAATPAASPGRDVYVVQKDDVLGTIALKRLGSSLRWNEIVAANPGLDPKRLKPGMELKMPTEESAKAKR